MTKKNLGKMGACVLALASVMGLAGCSSTGGSSSQESGAATSSTAEAGTIKIGFSGPLTGGAASYGLAVEHSAQMAVDEINANGGLNGCNLELMATDDVLVETTAEKNYANMYEQGMQVSLGCVTSGACLAYGRLAKEDSVFCLTPSATNDGVPAVGDNMYQMCFSDSGQGTASANYLTKNYSGKKIGIFYDSSDAYSKGIYDNFTKTFTGTITATASFTSSTKTDFSGQITQLMNCDVIFMPIYYSEAALFITQAKDKVAANAVYFGCDGLDGIESVKNFDANAYTQEISYLSHFNAASTDEAVVSYVTKYKATYGSDTLNQFGASAYDCVYALYQAMGQSNTRIDSTTKPETIYSALKDVFQSSSFSYSGVTGKNITWNADGTVSKEAGKYVVNPNRAAA